MAAKPRRLSKALAEDGRTVVALLSDGRFEVLGPAVKPSRADRSSAIRREVEKALNAVGQETGEPRFRPANNDYRDPRGLRNSGVPLGGGNPGYAEADVPRGGAAKRLGAAE